MAKAPEKVSKISGYEKPPSITPQGMADGVSTVELVIWWNHAARNHEMVIDGGPPGIRHGIIKQKSRCSWIVCLNVAHQWILCLPRLELEKPE